MQAQSEAQEAREIFISSREEDDRLRLWLGTLAGVATIGGTAASIASMVVFLPLLPVVSTVAGIVAGVSGFYARSERKKRDSKSLSSDHFRRGAPERRFGRVSD